MVVTVADDTDVAGTLLYHWKEHHGAIVFFFANMEQGLKNKTRCKTM